MSPTPSSPSPLSTPQPAARFLLPFLAGVAFVSVGVFVYFQFFSSPSLQTAGQDVSDVDDVVVAENGEVDPVYQADYDEGYSAGYADGRSVNGQFYDSYDEPATLERQVGYFDGYYDGFLRGCEEGNFDCSEIEYYRVDYESGYDAGYNDGYGETSEFFDSYVKPVEQRRQRSYLNGYFDGFFAGCDDGNFDCSEVQQYRDIYEGAYDAGYVDGAGEESAFLDLYAAPVDDAFVGVYNEGYFDGFLDGCDDEGFDCSDVSVYREELYADGDDRASVSDMSDVH